MTGTKSSLDHELEELEKRRPTPPQSLYKYVIPDRIDVLEKARIRFTPPLNTNDIFEVRQTFDLIMGPKMQQYFKEVSAELDFDQTLNDALADSPLADLTPEGAKALVSMFGGGDLEAMTRGILGQLIDQMPEHLNTPESIDTLLERVAGKQLLLSLSERPDSSPMWAHYAANSAGFVIAFDTSSEFFEHGEDGNQRRLHKVEYFDGRIPELMDNPYAALISKQADWSYEREWRLYAKSEDVTSVLKSDGTDIHLISFPVEAVNRVILGLRASTELAEGLRAVLGSNYPGVPMTRLKADRSTATLIEEPA